MGDRMSRKVAVIVGGGQTHGETIGNGRVAAILYAREGARVFVVDRDLSSANDTVTMIRGEGGEADLRRQPVGHVAHLQDGDPGDARRRARSDRQHLIDCIDLLDQHCRLPDLQGGREHADPTPGHGRRPPRNPGQRDPAALFLASDEAKFITGVLPPVDGGQSVRRG